MFVTPVKSYVGDKHYMKRDWHAWAVAVVPQGPEDHGKGKHLLVYDCDNVKDSAELHHSEAKKAFVGTQKRQANGTFEVPGLGT